MKEDMETEAAVRNPQTGLTIHDRPRYKPGHALGLAQPGLHVQISLPAARAGAEWAEAIARIGEWIIGDGTGPGQASDSLSPEEPRLAPLILWYIRLLGDHGHPVFDEARVIRLGQYNPCRWLVALPCQDVVPALAALRISVHALAMALDSVSGKAPSRASLDQRIERHRRELEQRTVSGFNTLHFLKEAHHFGIPWFRFSRNTFQLGHGAASRLVDSSLTDATPHISAVLARNKRATSDTLRAAGLPVPDQAEVTTADQAIEAAGRIGYPVVVKPSNREGGDGVSAGLRDAGAVRTAFGEAVTLSDRVLVERHVEGRDYRFHVVNGEVHAVLERTPGGVTGDGRHTVRELVDLQNRERATAQDDRRHLHPIQEDAEASRMLAQSGLDWNAVPEHGAFVPLRAVSNVTRGGVPRELPLDEVHPANRALAARAARILRLDIAGVDLLMPDIGQPWTMDTAGICEVNAQPQMFTTQHAATLRAIMPPSLGRIPVIVMLGGTPAFRAALYERLVERHPGAGMVADGAIHLPGEPDAVAAPDLFSGARALLMDRALDALILAVSDLRDVAPGWPVPTCDVLLIAGGEDEERSARAFTPLCRSAQYLAPRRVLIDSGYGAGVAASRAQEWLGTGVDDGTVASMTRDRMVDAMLDALAGGAY